MEDSLRVCLVQMTSTNNHPGNIEFLDKAVHYAAANNCQLVALPEAAGMMNKDKEDARKKITDEPSDPYINACKSLAAEHGVWIHTGSTPVASDDNDGRFWNHTNLIDNQGMVRARYNKIHLFDVFLAGRPPTGESNRYSPGSDAVVVDTPWGPWGMSICYDLRFPHLYRDYAKLGSTILFIPSAFTVSTGEAHWEVLLRARAIETGSFVIAAAQVGTHADGRQTWGHSIIVDPWGKLLLDMGGTESGFQIVDLDIGHVERARTQIPSLKNEREYRVLFETIAVD